MGYLSLQSWRLHPESCPTPPPIAPPHQRQAIRQFTFLWEPPFSPYSAEVEPPPPSRGKYRDECGLGRRSTGGRRGTGWLGLGRREAHTQRSPLPQGTETHGQCGEKRGVGSPTWIQNPPLQRRCVTVAKCPASPRLHFLTCPLGPSVLPGSLKD